MFQSDIFSADTDRSPASPSPQVWVWVSSLIPSFQAHISNVSRPAYFHLRHINRLHCIIPPIILPWLSERWSPRALQSLLFILPFTLLLTFCENLAPYYQPLLSVLPPLTSLPQFDHHTSLFQPINSFQILVTLTLCPTLISFSLYSNSMFCLIFIIITHTKNWVSEFILCKAVFLTLLFFS